ncbi:hypothetical protein CSB93_0903 [Pseudomonas paraeruginosa]|uniref:Uncharacterized protein n=1 Tax=Pseudomonas paraeruginosa TaxID=2994495 RepID=A0A2R3IZF8_9PSED|nr:hypothetical protein CSB93_0903 [Pseudomonas paraeruginosa]
MEDGLGDPSIILLLGFYPIPGRPKEAGEMFGGVVRRFRGV